MTITPEAPAPRRPLAFVGVALAVTVCLALLWRETPLPALLDPHRLARMGGAVRASPLAPALVLVVYIVAALVLFPLTPLLVATALVFDSVRGFVFGLGGSLVSAAITYGVGRLLARRRAHLVHGPRFLRVRDRLRGRGVLAVATMRLVPVGSFSLGNVAAGALEIPFRDYMLGNVLGLLPGILALTFLADRLRGIAP